MKISSRLAAAVLSLGALLAAAAPAVAAVAAPAAPAAVAMSFNHKPDMSFN